MSSRPHLRYRAAVAAAAIAAALLTACSAATKPTASNTTAPTAAPTTAAPTTAAPTTAAPTTAAPTTASTVAQRLGALLITPAGFALSTSTDVTNGPVDPSTFDEISGLSNGAASSGFVGGYTDTWDQITGDDYVQTVVFQFQTSSQAKKVLSALVIVDKASEDGGTSSGFSPIPGAVSVDFNTAATDGTYDHDIVAAKGNRILAMTYVSSDINAVNRVGALAVQQYRAL